MRNERIRTAIRLLPFVAAVLLGLGAGRFVVSEWVMPRPPQFAAWRAGRNGRGVAAAPTERVNKDVREERKIAENGLPRKHQWIAEVKVGPYRPRAVRVAGVNKDGSPQLKAIDLEEARRGFAAAVRNSRRRGVKAPVNERWGKLVDHSAGENGGGNAKGGGKDDSKEKLPPGIYPGDVYLDGIPMIDQGRTAYCAVASAARVLQHYGIDMTMEDMAELAGASATGGTNIRLWDQALSKVARDHGLELKVIPELTETFTPLSQLMYDYNHMARDMGYAEVNTWDYLRPGLEDYRSFWRDREYPVVRELMLSDERKLDAFDENVIGRINDSDPLFWSVTTGDVAEEIPELGVTYMRDGRGAHMRLIIGYNEERCEVLYSDSWGEGHELKRMDGRDALSITKGMYYLTD